MTRIKMFGLVALAAMAAVGSGSAMAESTALCLLDPGTGSHEVCPSGQLRTHVHEVTVPGIKAELLSSVVNALCEVLFLGDTTSSLASPLVVLGHYTYSNCETESKTPCTFTEVSSDSKIEILKLGHELADVTYGYEVHVQCGTPINCTYDGVGLKGHRLGPLLAALEGEESRVSEQTLTKTSGTFCPKTATLDSAMTATTSNYITE